MTQYIYVCTGARVGHRLERAANMITINNIHILTSTIVQTSQACYLANIIYIVPSDTHHEMSI